MTSEVGQAFQPDTIGLESPTYIVLSPRESLPSEVGQSAFGGSSLTASG
jgi:hypothetical protein